MTVLLLRHGRSTSNTAHTLAGRSPGVDLDDRGREQAEAGDPGTRTSKETVRPASPHAGGGVGWLRFRFIRFRLFRFRILIS